MKKGFVLNGQIDLDTKLVPYIDNILHTYRGDLEGTVLEKKAELLGLFYEEMYANGIIKEESFENKNVPPDTSYHNRTIALHDMKLGMKTDKEPES